MSGTKISGNVELAQYRESETSEDEADTPIRQEEDLNLSSVQSHLNHIGLQNETAVTHRTGRSILVQETSEDEADTPIRQEEDLNFSSVQSHLGPKLRGILIGACYCLLAFLINDLTKHIQPRGSPMKSPQSQSLLTPREALFSPEVSRITFTILCYITQLFLIWPLSAGLQAVFVLILVSAAFYAFFNIAPMEWGSVTYVACGSFRMQLIWFIIIAAVGFSIICLLLTLLGVWLLQRSKKGRTQYQPIEPNLDSWIFSVPI